MSTRTKELRAFVLQEVDHHPSDWVSDLGVGIFKKITHEKHLLDERQALLELAKGKLTTDPTRHTGEGIFFTSRVMDEFAILSGDLTFTHRDGAKADYIFDAREDGETSESVQGTRVMMQLDTNTDRTVQGIFDDFSPPDAHTFAKTCIPVKLAVYEGSDLVSRSQAKRLMARTERFKDVVLDFAGVEGVGQAFADEVFRVWQAQHPDVKLTHVNASQQIEGMIVRACAELKRQTESSEE